MLFAGAGRAMFVGTQMSCFMCFEGVDLLTIQRINGCNFVMGYVKRTKQDSTTFAISQIWLRLAGENPMIKKILLANQVFLKRQ